MSPVLPVGGIAGWNFLSRTIDAQKQVADASAPTRRETTYFRERIGTITDARALVEDFTLLKVALGAFGLQDDQQNRFFIQRVLEDGTTDGSSLANRLSDPRYRQLADAFGFGDPSGPRTTSAGFADGILAAYRDQSFEVAVGAIDPDMRLALGFPRELDRIVESLSSEDARWFGVMGAPPLRAVFDKAFGFPDSFAALEIDQQITSFRARSEALFGVSEVADFIEPAMQEALRTRFLLMSEIQGGGLRGGSAPILSLFSGTVGTTSILQALYAR